MSHEMGHYVLHHVLWSLLMGFLGVLLGLYLVYRLSGMMLQRWKGRFGFDRLSDVASLPLILLVFQLISVALLLRSAWRAVATWSMRRTALPGTDARQSRRRNGFCTFAERKPRQPSPRPAVHAVARQPPESWPADRLCQYLSALGGGQTAAYGHLFKTPARDPIRRTMLAPLATARPRK